MGENNNSRHIECDRLFGEQNSDTHSPAYGLDRYSWQQGENAQFGFTILENVEPSIVAKGGQQYVVRDRWILYQDRVGSLCATDCKWVQQEQVMQNKLILQKRTE